MTDRGLLYSKHVLNKGFILLEALLQASLQDASNKIKLIIWKNLPLILGPLVYFDVEK